MWPCPEMTPGRDGVDYMSCATSSRQRPFDSAGCSLLRLPKSCWLAPAISACSTLLFCSTARCSRRLHRPGRDRRSPTTQTWRSTTPSGITPCRSSVGVGRRVAPSRPACRVRCPGRASTGHPGRGGTRGRPSRSTHHRNTPIARVLGDLSFPNSERHPARRRRCARPPRLGRTANCTASGHKLQTGGSLGCSN